MGRLVHNTRLWAVVGIVAVGFAVMPILSGAARIALLVVGVLLLLAATWRILSPRTGDGDHRGPQERQPGMPEAGDGGRS